MENTGGHLAAGALAGVCPGNSTYHLYQCRYGVKWPNGSGFHCIDGGYATELSAEFDTPWGRRQQRFCVLCLRVSAVRSVMSMPKKAVVSADTASMTMAG